MDFTEFDMSHVEPYNIGLHFGTEAAARSRIDYLRENGSANSCRILKCQVDIRNPLRVEDVFGRSYGGALIALQDEADRRRIEPSLRNEIDTLVEEWMGSDDNPALMGDDTAYAAYCTKLNREIVRLFKALGYDGLVYVNELEDGKSEADSYVVFDGGQASVVEDLKVMVDVESP